MKRNALALAFLLATLPACHRRATPGVPAAAATTATTAEQARTIRHHGQGAEEAGVAGREFAGEQDDDDGGGGKNGGDSGGGRYKDPMVYVDGEIRASLAFNEMPAGVKLHEFEDEDGAVGHRMLVCDYLHELGADCDTIKESHWYGGRSHIAVITGAELRRFRNSLYFKFTRDLAGKPQMEWATKLHTRDRPDLIGNVAIYIHKPLPHWNSTYETMVDDTGRPWEGVPYAHEDGKRGVRINVDGTLRARLKRNLLEGNVTAINEGKPNEVPRYRLKDFLASQKVAVGQVRGVDLIVRDERVVRVPVEDAQDVQFTAAKQHHGEMMFYFGTHFVPVQAVNVWLNSAPPTRLMRTVTLGAATADRGSQPQAVPTQVQARR